ncbi:MAG TPA: DUF4231 domain-containing protein [Gaiellaceae bacterium]|jgi:hypothetical protein
MTARTSDRAPSSAERRERSHPFRKLIRKPALTRQLPQLWGVPQQWPILSEEEQRRFPGLQDDFRVLKAELEGPFLEFDREALAGQNRFRLVNLLLIAGGAVATALGAVQAAAHGGKFWIGIAEAALAGLLAPLAIAARGGKAHRAYFTNRLKAERLRSEYFVFLARAGEYHGTSDEQRVNVLRGRIAAIEDAEVGS